MQLRPLMRLTEGGGERTASSSMSGASAATPADPSIRPQHNQRASTNTDEGRATAAGSGGGSRFKRSQLADGGSAAAAGGSGAGRASQIGSHMLGPGGAGGVGSGLRPVRRSVLGAVLEAHAAAGQHAVDQHEQVSETSEVLCLMQT